MMRRIIPHPGLSGFLVIVWLLLANTFTLNSLVLAVILSILIPQLTVRYWPDRPKLRRPLRLIPYAALVLWDVIIANFQVARIILFMPADQIRSAFLTVPIDLDAPEAIALLAGTITLTPGTLTTDVSADRKSLLIHALHAPDPQATINEIKSRYEARLIRIFH